MAAKLSRLTHKIAIQLHLVQTVVPLAVVVPGGQSGNFWIHPPIADCDQLHDDDDDDVCFLSSSENSKKKP
jgi:hypothetical protein